LKTNLNLKTIEEKTEVLTSSFQSKCWKISKIIAAMEGIYLHFEVSSTRGIWCTYTCIAFLCTHTFHLL